MVMRLVSTLLGAGLTATVLISVIAPPVLTIVNHLHAILG